MPRLKIFTTVTKPQKTLFYTFAALYALALLYFHHGSYNDPGSLFFNPTIAYSRHYSELRRQQAEEYIIAASNPRFEKLHGNPAQTPNLCIGITSTIHDPARNIDFAIGSLLEGLTKYERDRLHFVALFNADDSNQSLELYQPWLGNLVDEILITNSTNASNHSEKELAQFHHLLETCQKTSAPYTAVFEPNIIALDGWLHRTLAALEDLEGMTTSDGRTPEDLLHLSLFYSERSLGWQSDDLPFCVAEIVTVFAAVAIGIFAIRKWYPASRPHITRNVTMAIFLVCTPLVVVLYFAAGKVTVLPPAPALHKGSHVGQYTQGLVLPREKVEGLLAWQTSTAAGSIANLLEQYVSKHGGTAWNLVPVVIQHIGKRTKNDEEGNQESKAHEVFNFNFEQNDVDKLRREHEKVAQKHSHS